MKMGFLLGRSPAGKQVLVIWALVVVPTGLSLRGPNMSPDISLLAVSVETAGSDRSESMAVELSDPLGWNGATGPANTAAYITPPSGGPSCQLPTATSLPVTDKIASRVADPVPGAGRLLAGSNESPELANPLAFMLARIQAG